MESLTEYRKIFKRIHNVRDNIDNYDENQLNEISKNIFSFAKNLFSRIYYHNKVKGQIRKAKNEVLRETNIDKKRELVLKQIKSMLKLEQYVK